MNELRSPGLPHKNKITLETREWKPNLDTTLPIDGKRDIPGFAAWISINPFNYDMVAGTGHKGYDFAAYLTTEGKIIVGLPENTPIRAVADGRIGGVQRSGSSYIGEVTIEHSGDQDSSFDHYGLSSIYTHVVSSVELGDFVKKGQVIGTLHKDDPEKTHLRRLVHLHLELWNELPKGRIFSSERQTDPIPILGGDRLELYTANPPRSLRFTVLGLPDAKIEYAHWGGREPEIEFKH